MLFNAYFSSWFWFSSSLSCSNPSDLDELGEIESKTAPFSSDSPADGEGEFILRKGEVDAIVELAPFNEDCEIGNGPVFVSRDEKLEFSEFELASADSRAAEIAAAAETAAAADTLLLFLLLLLCICDAATWRDECKFCEAVDDEFELEFEGFAESGCANDELGKNDDFVSVTNGGGLFVSFGDGGNGVDFIRGIDAGFINFCGVKLELEIKSVKLERAVAFDNGLGNGGACFLTYSIIRCNVNAFKRRKSHWTILEEFAYSGS